MSDTEYRSYAVMSVCPYVQGRVLIGSISGKIRVLQADCEGNYRLTWGRFLCPPPLKFGRHLVFCLSLSLYKITFAITF